MIGMGSEVFIRLGITTEVAIGFLVLLRLWLAVGSKPSTRDVIGISAYVISCVLAMFDLGYYLFIAERYRGWERQGLSSQAAYALHAQKASRPSELKLLATSIYTYLIELWLVKFAFLLLYSNLFRRVSSQKKKLLIFTAIYLVVTFGICAAYTSVVCYPTSSNWARNPADRCLVASYRAVYVMYAGFHLSSDLLLVAVPLTIFGSLKLGHAEKGAVVFVIFMGTLSVITSIIRTAVFVGIPLLPSFGVKSNEIGPIEYCNAIIYVDALEKVSMYIAYCLPAMKRVLRSIFLADFFSKAWSVFDSTLLSWKSKSMTGSTSSKSRGHGDQTHGKEVELHESNDSQVQLNYPA